jgi:hypothetical protein
VKAKFIYEFLSSKVKWDWTFKNEKIIEIFKYKEVPIKVIKVGNDPPRYYAITSLGSHDRPMTYYNLKKAIDKAKQEIDLHKHFMEENMQIPFRNNGNKYISQKYPLENPNYLGDCANDDKKLKNKRRKINKYHEKKD